MPIFTRELLYTEINNIYELILLISEKIEDLSLKLDDFKKMLYVDKLSPCFNIKEALTAIQFKEFLEEHALVKDVDISSESDDDDTLNKVHSILISYIEKSINTNSNIIDNNNVKNEIDNNINNISIDSSNTVSINNSNNISKTNSIYNSNDNHAGINEIADFDISVESKNSKIALSDQPDEECGFNNKEEISKLFINNDEIKNLLLNYKEQLQFEPTDNLNMVNKTKSDSGLNCDVNYDISNNLWLEHNDIHKPTEPKPKNTSYKNNHRRPSINNILQKFY